MGLDFVLEDVGRFTVRLVKQRSENGFSADITVYVGNLSTVVITITTDIKKDLIRFLLTNITFIVSAICTRLGTHEVAVTTQAIRKTTYPSSFRYMRSFSFPPIIGYHSNSSR